MPDPIYSPDNCNLAYQLDWSYSLFWRQPPSNFDWRDDLKSLLEEDGIRMLQHRFNPPKVSQFLLSTKPHVSPKLVVQRIKGRLQHLVRKSSPKALQRNYSIRGIGSTKREKLEEYLDGQIEHHPIADRRIRERCETYQIVQPEFDLSKPRRTAHALYWYNLHLVLVNDWRWREIRHEVILKMREMLLKSSQAKDHRLARAAVLPDHMHLLLGCPLEQSPQGIALGYLNNLAYACEMKPVFRFSYFAGTFSEYDLGVIPFADSAES